MATKRLDINTASIEELTELPMIDEQRAQVLVKQRPFHDWFEIDELPGFGPRLVGDLQQEGAYLGGQGAEMKYVWEQEEEPESR
jgi:DNA uptake protein ComE-like DNA-binding protein